MKKPSGVLFDLGNVLISFRPETFWERLGLSTKEERNQYAPKVGKLTASFELGSMGKGEFFTQLENAFDGRYARVNLEEAMASVLTKPIEGMETLVSRVAKKTAVALVSNTNEFHFEYCVSAVPALKLFPAKFLSHKLGVMKPDPRYYQRVLADLKISPDELYFIDDVQENIEGAEKAGMRGILFKSARELEGLLSREGVIEGKAG